jgi:DNA-binding response OmpR family regulator
LLLVDGDTRSLRVLEVSLRKAGFSVTPAVSVGDALDKLEINAPDLIISETKFATELDGFELRRRLRGSPAWADIPFIFLTAETAIENKIKGLELGVDDYLTKPIYIKEIVTRINILLQKRQRQFLDLKKDGTRFAGRVADMPVVDVIQTIEVSRKSGVIQFSGPANRQAAIYFRDGKVIDAEAGTLQGEDAVYRLLTWNEGEFEVEFRTVRRREAITTSSQGLLMEGMRRLDEWSRLLEQLPPLSHRFEIDAAELATRLGEIPDDNNRILRLFDGKRTLLEVIDASDFGDLECLQAISRLYFEGLLIDLDPGVRTKRDTGKPMPFTIVEGGVPSTPIEEVVSGPIDIARLSARTHDDEDDAQDSTAPAEPVAPSPGESTAPAEVHAVEASAVEPADVPRRARRPSAEQIDEGDVVEEEEIRGPLSGGYRQSSLRLIDEAVAAAQAIEPSLFEPEELIAAGVLPAPKASDGPTVEDATGPTTDAEAPLARIKIAARASDPRIDNARNLVEKSPALTEPAVPPEAVAEAPSEPTRRRKETTKPPPIPVKAQLSKQEIAEAPLLEPDPYTSGEHKLPTEEELAPFVEAEPYTSGEYTPVSPPEDYSGVPTVIEADENSSGDLYEEGPTDPSRRRFAATIRRDDSQGLRMIGSHGRDRAEASGEVRLAARATAEGGEPQRELVTILPRRITRELPTVTVDESATTPDAKAKAETSPAAKPEAKADAKPEAKVDAKAEAKPGKPAVEPPPRPPPPRRVSVEGGVVRQSGPGRGAKILIAIASVLAGATVYSYCKKHKPASTQPQAAVFEDAPAQIVTPAAPDATEYAGGFGIDAAVVAQVTPDAAIRVRPDAAVAMTPPIDAAVAVARPDAAIVPRPDAAVIATVPRDAATGSATPTGDDKTKEARQLYDKGHDALEEGDAAGALELLDESLKLRKTARTYLDRARALQRLGRVDDAVASVDEAIKMNSSYAPAYEQKGMLLWSAQRYQEARPVLEKYLELDPNGKRATLIRGMLDEQK